MDTVFILVRRVFRTIFGRFVQLLTNLRGFIQQLLTNLKITIFGRHELRADFMIRMGAMFFAFISFLMTFFSLRDNIFAISPPEIIAKPWESEDAYSVYRDSRLVYDSMDPSVLLSFFLKSSVLPFVFALGLALFILGLKRWIMNSGLEDRKVTILAFIALFFTISVSVLFNYDLISRMAYDPFVVQQQRPEVYSTYKSYLINAARLVKEESSSERMPSRTEEFALEEIDKAFYGVENLQHCETLACISRMADLISRSTSWVASWIHLPVPERLPPTPMFAQLAGEALQARSNNGNKAMVVFLWILACMLDLLDIFVLHLLQEEKERLAA